MPLYLLNRAMWIAFVALVIAGWLWASGKDAQVRQAATEEYCRGVAIWTAEEARGVPAVQRTGHPDYDEIAADACPGLRPAYPAETPTTPRQLAQD